jgi:CheY-like chemotaxis protein
MKILLIDDRANKGWRQLLEMIFPIQGIQVVPAISVEEAKQSLEDKYDIIFLDVRLERDDHNHRDVKKYSGFKVLEYIKSDFLNVNFSTPIMLFTASNKIWSIQEFLNYGVDAFYVKEHPDYLFSKETSRSTYQILMSDFERLRELSLKRSEFHRSAEEVIKKVCQLNYFKSDKYYENVKNRITDKIKLAYYYKFKQPNELEKEELKVDNEALAFLICFSILEEIVKGFSNKTNWNDNDFNGDWKFRNDTYFITTLQDKLVVDSIYNTVRNTYSRAEFHLSDDNKYKKGQPSFSEQVYALLHHYGLQEQELFKRINKERNKLNYTHSSVSDIYNEPLVRKNKSENYYSLSSKTLNFIRLILEKVK